MDANKREYSVTFPFTDWVTGPSVVIVSDLAFIGVYSRLKTHRLFTMKIVLAYSSFSTRLKTACTPKR